ncbi:hypothetical protein F2P79_006887 [Pimephales promelas]|nr:hypothetical protein F2P79_006887 [Pimephales promelas]
MSASGTFESPHLSETAAQDDQGNAACVTSGSPHLPDSVTQGVHVKSRRCAKRPWSEEEIRAVMKPMRPLIENGVTSRVSTAGPGPGRARGLIGASSGPTARISGPSNTLGQRGPARARGVLKVLLPLLTAIMFCVVQFFDGKKSVSVVPQSWYNGGFTFWPNYTSDERINKAVKFAEVPGHNWSKRPVRLLKTCGTIMATLKTVMESLHPRRHQDHRF